MIIQIIIFFLSGEVIKFKISKIPIIINSQKEIVHCTGYKLVMIIKIIPFNKYEFIKSREINMPQ